MANERKVGAAALLSYGCGDLYGGGSFLIISTLFIFFLTDLVGLKPAMAGLVVFAGKAWDAVSDPLMGCISDRTRSRLGRRRVYFLAGIVPVFASFALLWLSVRTGNPTLDFLYYLGAYMLFATVSTMVMIPYSTLPTEMTHDYRERTRLSGSRMIFSQLSSILAGTLPGYLVKNLYREDPGRGFLVMGLGFGLFFALPWLLVYRGTWELPESERRMPSASLAASFRDTGSLLRCRSFRLHVGLYLAGYSAIDILSALFIYFLSYYVGRSEAYTLCLGSMLIAQLLALPAYLAFANRFGKGRAYALGALVFLLGSAAFAAVGPGAPTALLLGLSAALGLGLSAVAAMPWAMLPESADADELARGIQRSGAVSGAFTLARKLVQAAMLWLVGILLQAIGYVPGAAQPPGTLLGLRLLFTLAPVALVALGGLLALRYPVSPASFAALRAELERRRAGSSGQTPEAERVELERITGQPYAQMGAGR
ncbi:MAG TPA: MFS transporter [Spirochaetia bacterium]|nr:MFS transporter [Spirochaetia bacterium]HRZ64914.1 MFS transporter [Spirochaetia bacterium]